MLYVMHHVLNPRCCFCTRSDPAMKQFLLNLDDTGALGRKFILHDLDDTHLFIEAEILKTIQDKINELMDKMSFPITE